MSSLVRIKYDDIFTDSLIIAKGTDNQHRSIKQTIRDYEGKFKELGALAFLKRQSTGGRPDEIIELNEPQASFLITLLRNSDTVVDFKLALVKEFYHMRRLLLERQSQDWQQARLQAKVTRLQETNAIKELIEYAKRQGSKNADKLYITYSNLVKQLAGYENRNTADIETLLAIMAFEKTLFGIITIEMQHQTHYKEIYQNAKRQLEQLKIYWCAPVGMAALGVPAAKRLINKEAGQ